MKQNLKKGQAYQQIKDKIITCQYPPGMLLSEAVLMDEIHAGRTPIREALSRLEQESLLTIMPKKGIVVSDITLKEIYDVYHVRALIEPHIIHTWGKDIPREQLERYRQRLSMYTEDMDLMERNELDDQMHRLILGCCTNRHLLQMSRHLYNQNQRIRIVVGQLAHRMEQNISDHMRITDHLLNREYSQAAMEMSKHIESARQETASLLHLSTIQEPKVF